MLEENFANYFIEANATSAPTKLAKCSTRMKQEGVDHDTKRARVSSCPVQTYNSTKMQQHSVLHITSSTGVAGMIVSYVDRGCRIPTWKVSCEHVVRIQYVREYKDRLGINMNTKPLNIFRKKLVHGKNPSDESMAISILSLHRQTWYSSITMIHSDQVILQWAGSPQALLVVYVLCTAVLCSTWYTCCCLLLLYTMVMRKKSKLRIYEYEKSEGISCVLLHSQTCISLTMTHPSVIRPYRCTTTEMQQRADTVPPVGRSGQSRVVS